MKTYVIQNKFWGPLIVDVNGNNIPSDQKVINPKQSIKVTLTEARVQELKKELGNRVVIKEAQ